MAKIFTLVLLCPTPRHPRLHRHLAIHRAPAAQSSGAKSVYMRLRYCDRQHGLSHTQSNEQNETETAEQSSGAKTRASVLLMRYYDRACT